MKTTTKSNRKKKDKKLSFNIPLQVNITETIQDRMKKRLQELCQTQSNYIRGLILKDIEGLK